MRLLVLSDTHGSKRNIDLALEAQPDAKHVFFCGDGLNDIYSAEIFQSKFFHKVRGNCDWNSNEKTTDLITLENKRILLTHGHIFGVKSGLSNLISAAKQNKADIVLFGHTHTALEQYIDGIHFLNPGSANNGSLKPSYGIVDITNSGIITNIVHY